MTNYKDLNDYEIMYMVEENNEDACTILFEKYEPLVKIIASKYRNFAKESGLDFEDLIQEGYLGLYSAVCHYDVDLNNQFYTYALVAIQSKIINCLRTNNTNKHRLLNESYSLFYCYDKGDELELIDFIEDKNALKPYQLITELDVNRQIKDFMYSLDFPNSLIFELKLNGFRNQEIAQLLDIPLKRVTNLLYKVKVKFKNSYYQ